MKFQQAPVPLLYVYDKTNLSACGENSWEDNKETHPANTHLTSARTRIDAQFGEITPQMPRGTKLQLLTRRSMAGVGVGVQLVLYNYPAQASAFAKAEKC